MAMYAVDNDAMPLVIGDLRVLAGAVFRHATLRGMLWGCWAPADPASARGSAYRPLVPWPQTETPASKNARTAITVRAF